MDRERYPDIITAGNETPYYTNSSQLPVGYTDDIFEVLKLQDELQSLYTGGTVQHLYLGESIEDIEVCKNLYKRYLPIIKCRIYRLRPPLVSVTNMDTSRRAFHMSAVRWGNRGLVKGYRVFKTGKEL